MTTTTLITAQSVGAASGVQQSAKITAQATTNNFLVSVEVTAGNGLPFPIPRSFLLCFASSPFSYTTGAAPANLRNICGVVNLPIPAAGALIATVNSAKVPLAGQYIYAWIESEIFANPVTVTISAQETI